MQVSLMGFKEWIIPQDRVFYDLFEKYVDHVASVVSFFRTMVTEWTDLEAKRQRLKSLEHEADEIGHEIFERLSRTFVTPLDREDIATLAHVMDDIVDHIHAAGNRIALFELESSTPQMIKFIDILEGQTNALVPAVKALRKASTRKQISDYSVEIHRLENEADRLLNRSVAELFKSNDPIRILKYKDVYDHLESATDRCEDVADVLNDILRKQG
jgi:uncharacterized protein